MSAAQLLIFLALYAGALAPDPDPGSGALSAEREAFRELSACVICPSSQLLASAKPVVEERVLSLAPLVLIMNQLRHLEQKNVKEEPKGRLKTDASLKSLIYGDAISMLEFDSDDSNALAGHTYALLDFEIQRLDTSFYCVSGSVTSFDGLCKQSLEDNAERYNLNAPTYDSISGICYLAERANSQKFVKLTSNPLANQDSYITKRNELAIYHFAIISQLRSQLVSLFEEIHIFSDWILLQELPKVPDCPAVLIPFLVTMKDSLSLEDELENLCKTYSFMVGPSDRPKRSLIKVD